MYAMEVLGAASLLALILKWWPSGRSAPLKICFFLYIFEYLFIRFFASVKCYDSAGMARLQPRTFSLFPVGKTYEGIELQFKKAMVPTSYIIPIFGLLLLLGTPSFFLYLAVLLLTVIAHVNVILLYFHLKDKETLPVNYFTHNKHLKA